MNVMKKILLALLTALILCLALAACDESSGGQKDDEPHMHSYDCMEPRAEHLKSEANCTQPAVYYVFCECGERNPYGNTFTVGEPNDTHVLNEWISEYSATCTADGVAGHYTCSA